MRAFLSFLVLLAGIAAVSANLAEPRRYQTDMASLSQGDGRVASFSSVAAADPAAPTAAPVAPFKTTVQVAKAQPRQEESASVPEVPAYVPDGAPSPLDAATRAALARDIQSELARLGCYAGPVDGNWSAETQRAAGLFVTEANARIPVGEPDFALFSLAKTATDQQACGPAVTVAQTPQTAPPAAMGLGGPDVGTAQPKAESYRRDRDVELLFTNPLGR